MKDRTKNDRELSGNHDVAWYDATLDAATWFGTPDVKPYEAAMVLCQFNPRDDCDPSITTNDEIGPDDFKRLLREFEGVANTDPVHRTLLQWLGVARERGLKYHSWIDKYTEAASAEAVERATPEQRDARLGSADWCEKAREIAIAYIARHQENDLFPSQSDVCSHVAAIMRKEKIFGPHGRPLEANYILRSAIQGKWWQENKP